MSCETCQYFEPGGKWSKGWCTYYRSYVYPSDSCNNYKGNSSAGCFLTTACCEYKNLPDDCFELETLRSFRDNWLKKQPPHGEADIAEYYQIAPEIVKSIKMQTDQNEIWENLYVTILECVALICNGNEKNNEKYLFEAYEKYKNMTISLKEQYL